MSAEIKRQQLARLQASLLSRTVPEHQIEDVERKCLDLMADLQMEVSAFYRHVPKPLFGKGVQLELFSYGK